jgi:hypothetical protein
MSLWFVRWGGDRLRRKRRGEKETRKKKKKQTWYQHLIHIFVKHLSSGNIMVWVLIV